MKNLTHYIDNHNNWNCFASGIAKSITFPLTQKDADDLARSLDGDLSPENLHCDGEISQAEAQRKYNYYGRVIRELEKECFLLGLNKPVVHEYY